MNKPARPPLGSLVPLSAGLDRLPPRRRWDHRYAGLQAGARSQPVPFVAACLPGLPERGPALDIAAGAGRHTIALAQWGLQVDAVDISWQGLRLARERAVKAGLTPGRQVRFIVADVERPWLPHRRYAVVVVTFFLYRPLFALIKERLLPGGRLVYESFTVQQATAPNQSRPIRPELLLKPNELRQEFSGFEILFYDEGVHNGKATAQLFAQKPGG